MEKVNLGDQAAYSELTKKCLAYLSADGAHAYVKKVCFKIPVNCFE